MSINGKQQELFIAKPPFRHPFRLRVNDCVWIDEKVGRVIRVTEAAAVVLVNRPPREFTTRFDKHVRFQPPPAIVRIAANSEIAILNRNTGRHKRATHRERSRK
jgi:hypothetical protein